MPPQLPWPGQACRVISWRNSSSVLEAAWKASTRSTRSPLRGRCPGTMEPSERTTAGTFCSTMAATVPTGGLSQATTPISPAT